MASFGIIAVMRWQESHYLFFLLCALRDFIAAYFLITRKEAIAKGNAVQSIIAYISTGLPLLYITGPVGAMEMKFLSDAFTIIGFFIVTMATIELGTSFGVSPARRGDICRTGVYKYFSHPMYLGYTIAHIGWLFISPWNFLIYGVSIGLYVMRGRFENKILQPLKFINNQNSLC